MDESSRRPRPNRDRLPSGYGYATVILARRRGMTPQEVASRLAVHRESVTRLGRIMAADNPKATPRDLYAVLGDTVDRRLAQDHAAIWTVMAMAGAARRLAGYVSPVTGEMADCWTESDCSVGPSGVNHVALFSFLVVIGLGLVASRATASATTENDHGNDADDRGPPSQRDVPLLTAAPSAPPAQAGHLLLLA